MNHRRSFLLTRASIMSRSHINITSIRTSLRHHQTDAIKSITTWQLSASHSRPQPTPTDFIPRPTDPPESLRYQSINSIAIRLGIRKSIRKADRSQLKRPDRPNHFPCGQLNSLTDGENENQNKKEEFKRKKTKKSYMRKREREKREFLLCVCVRAGRPDRWPIDARVET